MTKIAVGAYESIEGPDDAQGLRHDHEGMEGPRPSAKAVPHQQLPSMMEMNGSHRHDVPKAKGGVTKEPPGAAISPTVVKLRPWMRHL